MPEIFCLDAKVLREINQLIGDYGVESPDNLEWVAGYAREFPEDAAEHASSRELVVAKAAFYLFHLVVKHPFVDGNKRTAFVAFNAFLVANGFKARYDETTISVALRKLSEKAKSKPIAALFRQLRAKVRDSSELRVLGLLFDLAQIENKEVYASVQEIIPLVDALVAEQASAAPPKAPKRLVLYVIDQNQRTIRLLGYL